VLRILKRWLVLVILSAASVTQATHLVGGFLTYRYLGSNGTNSQYRVNIYSYRDCSPLDGGVKFDTEVVFVFTMTIGLFLHLTRQS